MTRKAWWLIGLLALASCVSGEPFAPELLCTESDTVLANGWTAHITVCRELPSIITEIRR